MAFDPVVLVVAAAPFFFPISLEVSWGLWFLGAAAMGCRSGGRRRTGCREMSKSLDPLYKGKVTLDLGRRIHAIEKWMEIWLNTCHKKRQTGGPLPPLRARIEETLWLVCNVWSFPKLTAQTRGGPSKLCPISLAATDATPLLMSSKLSDPLRRSTWMEIILEEIYNFRLLDLSLRTVVNIRP